MDNFKAIYKILKTLDTQKGNEKFDNVLISAQELKIPYEQWENLVVTLQSEGYIKGVVIDQTLTDKFPHIVDFRPQITLKGMEYLADNSMMKKVGEALRMTGEFATAIGAFLPR